jgi:DNA-binding XRE family transcriptional regulator
MEQDMSNLEKEFNAIRSRLANYHVATLAKAAGISTVSIYAIRDGEQTNPRLKSLIKLDAAMQVIDNS